MARDANGNFTNVAGVPVTGSTVISSTVFNNFAADIATAITESLSTEGDGGMNTAFQNQSGTVSAAGITWEAETNSGFYRVSAGVFAYAVGGVKVFGISASGIDATAGLSAGTLIFADGSITDSGGAIDFGNENLSTTGTLTASGGGALTGTWSDLGTVTTVDIDGGTMDGVTIGGSVTRPVSCTTLNASGAATIVAGTINGVVIGATSALAGTFTTVNGTTATFSTYVGLPAASTILAGVVQLYDGADSISTTLAPTAAALKAVNDALAALGSGDMLSTNNLSDVANAVTARSNLGLAIGTNVMAYDATMLVDADIGVNVMAYDATMLVDADIGGSVQAYDADLDVYAANPLTATELIELQAIGATTISATQWGYLGDSVGYVGTVSTAAPSGTPIAGELWIRYTA